MVGAQNLGIFRLSEALIEDHPELVMRLLGRTIILSAKPALPEREIEYLALSPEFEEIPDEAAIPVYDVKTVGLDIVFTI
jgi:hypothetical protein